MFDIGWSELLLIAIIAVIFIGPKDIPVAMRALGRMMGKARAITREFQASIDEVMRESELDELRRQIEKAAEPVRLDDDTGGVPEKPAAKPLGETAKPQDEAAKKEPGAASERQAPQPQPESQPQSQPQSQPESQPGSSANASTTAPPDAAEGFEHRE